MVDISQIGSNYHVTFKSIPIINVINSREIETRLVELTKKEGTGLVLNLSEVKFIDSSGFEALLNVYRSAKLNNSTFKLINVSSEAYELLKLVELDKVFEVA